MLTKEEKHLHVYQSIFKCQELPWEEVWRDPHGGEQRQEVKDFKNFVKKTIKRGF